MKEKASLRNRSGIVFAVLSVLMIAFAFIHSSMNADTSSAESDGIEKLIMNILRLFGISDISHISLRKIAHFSEFTVIGALLCCTAHSFFPEKTYRISPLVLLIGLLCALCDETIQIFSEGRASLVTDVWIDFGGVVTGTALILLLFLIIDRLKQKRGLKKTNESKS